MIKLFNIANSKNFNAYNLFTIKTQYFLSFIACYILQLLMGLPTLLKVTSYNVSSSPFHKNFLHIWVIVKKNIEMMRSETEDFAKQKLINK